MGERRFRITMGHLVTVVVAVTFGLFLLTTLTARNLIGALFCPAPMLALIVFLLPEERGKTVSKGADGGEAV